HLLHEEAEQCGRELPSEHQYLPGQARREVVERVAGGENDPADAGGAVADQQLNERGACVVADDGGAAQVEAVEELSYEPCDPPSDRSASACIAWRCAPSGSVGATHR